MRIFNIINGYFHLSNNGIDAFQIFYILCLSVLSRQLKCKGEETIFCLSNLLASVFGADVTARYQVQE